MQRILVTVITTIVVTITEPVWFHTNVGFLTFEMVGWAGRITWTTLVSLVACYVVFAVIDTIANLSHWDATLVRTSEFTRSARAIHTTLFV